MRFLFLVQRLLLKLDRIQFISRVVVVVDVVITVVTGELRVATLIQHSLPTTIISILFLDNTIVAIVVR